MLYFYRFESERGVLKGSGNTNIATSFGNISILGSKCLYVFPEKLMFVDCYGHFPGPSDSPLIEAVVDDVIDLGELDDGTILKAELVTENSRETLWLSKNNTKIVQPDTDGNEIIAASLGSDKYHLYGGFTRVIPISELPRFDGIPNPVGFLTWGDVYERLPEK